jgi:hypothetical protein
MKIIFLTTVSKNLGLLSNASTEVPNTTPIFTPLEILYSIAKSSVTVKRLNRDEKEYARQSYSHLIFCVRNVPDVK